METRVQTGEEVPLWGTFKAPWKSRICPLHDWRGGFLHHRRWEVPSPGWHWHLRGRLPMHLVPFGAAHRGGDPGAHDHVYGEPKRGMLYLTIISRLGSNRSSRSLNLCLSLWWHVVYRALYNDHLIFKFPWVVKIFKSIPKTSSFHQIIKLDYGAYMTQFWPQTLFLNSHTVNIRFHFILVLFSLPAWIQTEPQMLCLV